VRLTDDPLAATLAEEADRAGRLGLLGTRRADLAGIFDLRLLNRVLAQRGEPAVDDAGLGVAATPTT
jgi:NitT/TauT family transport system substrate-binding protein